jgi:conjugal transfer pilus assembly protein TraK
MPMIRLTLRPALLALLLAISLPASAIQILDGVDGQTLVAKISQKELTRVTVERGRIKKVTGNAGEFLLEKDEEKGQIYIRPTLDTATKPINLFVSTERATFTLLLQPVDLPAETIMIKDRAARSETARIERSSAYMRVIKNLLLAMASDTLPREMEIREMAKQMNLWKEARFVLTRTYLGHAITGEKYVLTNVSGKSMVIAEQELYQAGVIAVSVENLNLRPDESSNVFVIRERSDHE